MEQSEVKLPYLFTESDIVQLMHRNRISINTWFYESIQIIQDKNYVTKTNKRFIPSSQGSTLIEIYQKFDINIFNLSLLTKINQELWSVATGVKSKEIVVGEVLVEASHTLDKLMNVKDEIICYLQSQQSKLYADTESPKCISYIDKIQKPAIVATKNNLQNTFETDLGDTEFGICPRWK